MLSNRPLCLLSKRPRWLLSKHPLRWYAPGKRRVGTRSARPHGSIPALLCCLSVHLIRSLRPLYRILQQSGRWLLRRPNTVKNFSKQSYQPIDLQARIRRSGSVLSLCQVHAGAYLDVVTVAKNSRVAAWFENDGKGHFTKHLIYEDQSAYDLRLVDMDGDGDLDLLVAGFESNNVVWYENRIRK